MRLRFALTHSVLGTVYISEPDGWADAVLKLERHPEFHSLIEYFEGSFIFYGTATEFITQVESEYGFDAELQINITYSRDDVTFESVFSGQLDISESVAMPDGKIQVPIIRNDFWAKFINRLDTPVNIQNPLSVDDGALDVINNVTLRLLSQIINFQSQYTGHSGDTNTLDDADLATTGNITLSGHQIIDGVMTTDDMRIVVKDQSTTTQNGIYSASSGAWSRTVDANTGTELETAILYVVNGTTNGGKAFKQYTNPLNLGTDPVVFQEYNYVDDYELANFTDPIDWVEYTFDFYLSGTVDPTIDEIDNTYTIPVVYNTTPDDIFEQIEITDGFGELEIDADISYSFRDEITFTSTGSITGFNITAELYVQKNEETPILIDNFFNFFMGYHPQPMGLALSGTTTIDVNVGDRIKIYSHFIFDPTTSTISGTWTSRQLFGGITEQIVNFNFKSKKLDSNAEAFLLHDVGAEISDRIIGQEDTFYSEYLGSPETQSRSYANRGCGANYVLSKGLQLRQYTLSEKPFFQSFNQWWNGINPILNLGLSYDEVAGEEVIRVEEKEFFYDPEISVYFDNVRDITKAYDNERIFKTIKAGYKTWQAEEISGLDDPQTKRTYASRITKSGVDNTLESEFIAASLAIETTRRKNREKSADYKFDDNTFIVSVRDGAGGVFDPETNQDFTTTDLNNPETRYNIRITPARNFVRWLNYFSGFLQSYLTSFFKFSSGEGNYDMTSLTSDPCEHTTLLSEKQDISPTTNYLHLAALYELSIPMEWEDYATIRNNRTKAIGISQTTEGHKAFFIKDMEYRPMHGTATIRAWAYEMLPINIIPSVFNTPDCIPPAFDDSCAGAYLTEGGDELITESGECLNLN